MFYSPQCIRGGNNTDLGPVYQQRKRLLPYLVYLHAGSSSVGSGGVLFIINYKVLFISGLLFINNIINHPLLLPWQGRLPKHQTNTFLHHSNGNFPYILFFVGSIVLQRGRHSLSLNETYFWTETESWDRYYLVNMLVIAQFSDHQTCRQIFSFPFQFNTNTCCSA